VDLARAYDHLARQHYFLGHNQTCRDLCHQALALLETLIAEAPSGELSDRRLDIVQANTRLGFAYWRDRQLDDALRHFNIALAIAQDEAARHPNTLPIEQALAHTLVGIGNIHRDRSEMDQAIAINERILRLRSRLSQTHPDNIPLLEDVFWTRNNLGLMYQLAGRLEEAEALLVSDIAERKAHSDAMPGSMVRLALRSFPLSLLAETRFLLGRIEDAWQTYRIAYEVDRHVADTDPSPHYQAGVAFSTARLAEVTLVLLAQPPHAQTGIIPPDTSQSMPWPDHLANAERGASVATGATPYPDMSPQNPTEASAYNPRHQCPYPGSTVRAHTLADIRVLAHQALAAANGAHARTPTNAFYCKAKARALLLRGRLLQLDGQADQAHQAWHEALQLLQPIAPPQTDPATEELRAALHHCLGQHAQAQQSHPFLKTRRWFSPLVQQVAGIQV
jgi:tetratricopeptide (TPR) repeat protein